MSKAQEILDGWAHYMNIKSMTTVEEKVAIDRANVCGSCPFAVKSDILEILLPDGNKKEIEGKKCEKCGCPLSTKVRSITSQCPLKLWKE